MISEFKELQEKYPATYDYELSRHRLLVNLVDVEAFGYELSCILAQAHIQGDKYEELMVEKDIMLENYGIDEIMLEESIERGLNVNLFSCREVENGYVINISKKSVDELREAIRYRRVFPALSKRYAKEIGEVNG